MNSKFDPQEMPIIDIDLNNTKPFKAARFLDNPEAIAAFITEITKANDEELLMQALESLA